MTVRLILAAVLCAAAATLCAQPYVQFQPGHASVPWYQPERSGEGVMFSLLDVGDGHVIFASIYLADPHPDWYVAQGDAVMHETCPSGWDHCYVLDLSWQAYPDRSVSWGHLWISPGVDSMRWLIMASPYGAWIPSTLRDGLLYPMLPIDVGTCVQAGFGPLPPLADSRWCGEQ